MITTDELRALVARPQIAVSGSLACNLRCTYCTQIDVLLTRVTDNFLDDPRLNEVLERSPPAYVSVSGGEPLMNPATREFVARAGRNGHKVIFDTNIIINRRRLAGLLDYWGPEAVGYINISHHLDQDIARDYIEERAALIDERGIPFFIKYVGVPGDLRVIGENMRYFRDRGYGVMCSHLQGPYRGRTFPGDYTVGEVLGFLDLFTMQINALQLFGGIRSKGLPCRSGQDTITWNMKGRGEVLPCVHGSGHPIALEETFFHTGERRRAPCREEACTAGIYFIYGFNGVMDEMDRFARLLSGETEFLGVDRALEFLTGLQAAGHRIVHADRLGRLLDARRPAVLAI